MLENVQTKGSTDVEELVDRSRLIGSDPTLVLYGGGNTSTKVTESDHLGRERQVLRVKGSGSDLRTITAKDFPGLYLDDLLAVRERDGMTDEQMVDYLSRCMVDPGARRPSIETLLHAFLPFKYVDHVHADAICALTNHSRAEEVIHEVLGDDIAYVPYLRPGFELSRKVAQLARHRAIVLEHHGLVTWGNTPGESYELTIELANKAAQYLESQQPKHVSDHATVLAESDELELLVGLRGLLSKKRRVILHVDPSQKEFANRKDIAKIAGSGRATLEHILRIGTKSAVIQRVETAAESVRLFETEYLEYVQRYADRLPAGVSMHNPQPKVMLLPSLGCVAAGADIRQACMNANIAYHSHKVAAQVLDVFGDIRTLSEQDIFDVDYWPLELYKLTLAPQPPEMSGHIILILGANHVDTGCISSFISKGAHIVLVDRNRERVKNLLPANSDQVVCLEGDPRDAAVIESGLKLAVQSFGGLDGVVLDVSEQDGLAVSRPWETLLGRQGIGGSIVYLVESSKPFQLQSNGRHDHNGIRENVLASGFSNYCQVWNWIQFLLSDRSKGVTDTVIKVC